MKIVGVRKAKLTRSQAVGDPMIMKLLWRMVGIGVERKMCQVPKYVMNEK